VSRPDPAFLADLHRQLAQDQAREDRAVGIFRAIAADTDLHTMKVVISKLAEDYLSRTGATEDYHDRLHELEDIRGVLVQALRHASSALNAHRESAPACEVNDCGSPARPCQCGAAHCPDHPHVEEP
jgi:hypothetical protein